MAKSRAEIGRQRRERTREALIETAMRVLARMGADAPTIDDFVAEAAVARGTFYNYFQTREELLVAVGATISDSILGEMAAIRVLPDPADRLCCSVRLFLNLAIVEPIWAAVIVEIALKTAPIGTNMQEQLAADVEDGLASGRFSCPSAQTGYDLVLGTAMMGMRSILRGEAGPRHVEHVAQAILTAFGVRDAAALARRPMEPEAMARRAAEARATAVD